MADALKLLTHYFAGTQITFLVHLTVHYLLERHSRDDSLRKGKGKDVPVLNYVRRHEHVSIT
jgi:hypothetical protein